MEPLKVCGYVVSPEDKEGFDKIMARLKEAEENYIKVKKQMKYNLNQVNRLQKRLMKDCRRLEKAIKGSATLEVTAQLGGENVDS